MTDFAAILKDVTSTIEEKVAAINATLVADYERLIGMGSLKAANSKLLEIIRHLLDFHVQHADATATSTAISTEAVRRVMPNVIANEIIGVSPFSGPVTTLANTPTTPSVAPTIPAISADPVVPTVPVVSSEPNAQKVPVPESLAEKVAIKLPKLPADVVEYVEKIEADASKAVEDVVTTVVDAVDAVEKPIPKPTQDAPAPVENASEVDESTATPDDPKGPKGRAKKA